MPIRNICVARGVDSATGQSTVYTVPAANAFILKSILLYNNGSASISPSVVIFASDASCAPVVEVPAIAAGATSLWSGWLVLNAGDSLRLTLSTAPLAYWISGAVLPYATP